MTDKSTVKIVGECSNCGDPINEHDWSIANDDGKGGKICSECEAYQEAAN